VNDFLMNLVPSHLGCAGIVALGNKKAAYGFVVVAAAALVVFALLTSV